MAASSSSQVVPKSWQVFISFSGQDLRNNFISHLEEAFTQADINYYIDTKEIPSESQSVIFTRIEQSQIALPIFSRKYAESKWCLNELVEVMRQVNRGTLRVIPVFFNVTPSDVGSPYGDFGCKVYVESQHNRSDLPDWSAALESVTGKIGLLLSNYSNERLLIQEIVAWVKHLLAHPPGSNNELPKKKPPVSSGCISSSTERPSFDDVMNQRLKQLEDKIDFDVDVTQVVGIVGMPGIGKTTLAEMYFNKWNDRYTFTKIIFGIRENFGEREEDEDDWLERTLLDGQESNNEADVFSMKIFLVLDDVTHKKHVDFLLKNRAWIRPGSKIVITTRDKSLIELLKPLVYEVPTSNYIDASKDIDAWNDIPRDKSSIPLRRLDTYMVPPLNDVDAWKLFKYNAFEDGVSATRGNFPTLTKSFVDYAGGNPLALEELGKELLGKDEGEWKARQETLSHQCNENIRTQLRISYDVLSEQQKDAFLDIACFFRSEEENYVKCLLDQYGSDDVVKDLVEKFFICISAGRIEMHNLLCTFGKELGSSQGNSSGKRMCDHSQTILILKDATQQRIQEMKDVRGMFLDTCTYKATNVISVREKRLFELFNPMNLRYLKFYDSLCPENCKVNFPDGLKFPFEEIRYLHWEKYNLKELPSHFDPKNLIDLRLLYCKNIERVWEAVKEVPRLKWVDLSHSTKLTDLSALSKASNLRRLNLKGCTSLDKLPKELQNMKKLVFLNLRGCKKLTSLPEKLNLISLKTIILSGCESFNKFELISENLEFLHLDGTIISTLPPTIKNFKKLVLLNLKNCTMLESLPPNCLDKLRALEELMLSGCSKLRNFPKIKKSMENLQIVLLDGTLIKMPLQEPLHMNGLSMLRRLSLSRNDKIKSLQPCISELYNLQWIDLRYCKNLTSLLTLPPNLQYLNAHACISLKTVASPLALVMPTERAPSSFIFTNCEKLEHVAKNEIICYAHNRTLISSDALNRHNKGLAFETLAATCYPGSVVPAWFDHKASGAVLERALPPYSDNGFVGIALCAIVSFQNYRIQNNNFMLKCIFELNSGKTSSRFFNFHIGDLSGADSEQQCTINSNHVFVGFTSLFMSINQYQEVEGEKRRVPAKASIKFEVTDGTCEDARCEVLKCGFSLFCESDNGSWDANADASRVVCESDNGVHVARPDDSNVDASSMEQGAGRGESIFFSLLGRIKLFGQLRRRFRLLWIHDDI